MNLQKQGVGSPNHVLKVIQTACNPQGWINQKEKYESLLKAINEVLSFYGLNVKDDGSLIQTSESSSTVQRSKSSDEIAFDSRNFHPQIALHGRSHFSRGSYFHAVFECCKSFDSIVGKNTGIGKSGQPLMSESMSLNGPLKFNSQQNQSERDEQQGVMYLCMGLMNAIRNPQAHEPELNWPMSREDALDVLSLISFLFRKIESAVIYDALERSSKKIEI